MPYEHQENYFSLAVKAEHLKNPDFMKVDVAQIEAGAKKHRAVMAKLNPAKPIPARVEYEALRRKLYNLQEAAKHSEVRLTNDAGTVSHCLTLISGFLKSKKVAAAESQLGQERWLESRLVATEADLATAQARLIDSQRNNDAVVRELSNFDGHDRIAELQTELAL